VTDIGRQHFDVKGKPDNIKVLLIEDNPDHVELIRDVLDEVKGAMFNVEYADRLFTGLERLGEDNINVILLDLSLPDCQGVDTFLKIHNKAPKVPVVVLSAHDDENIATEAVQAGAQDYLIKGQVDGKLLGRSICYAIERNRILNDLANERERLAVTISSMCDGFISTDIHGRVILLNKEAENLTGWSQEEAIGKPLADVFNIIDQKNKKRCENPVEKILKDGKVVGDFACHTVLITRDGAEKVISDCGAPIRDKDGKFLGVVLVFNDVTQKRKIEEELHKAQKLESIGILAGGIAHDFNNILTAVLGNVSLAKTSINPQDDAYRLLTEAEKATMRASDLTQQLLTFSKGGAPVIRTTSIAGLLKDSTSFALRGSKVRCEYSIPDNFWPVEIDEGQIGQVINNLIINADQAMPEGGTIKMDCENIIIDSEDIPPLGEGKYVKITIKDDGPGIPKDNLEKIFNPYFTTKLKGSGLGLASTYSIIRKHEGHISVESEIGVGTTFYIYLPASPIKVRRKNNTEFSKEKMKRKPPLSKGNILVMEDEESVRDVLVNMLDKLSYKITSVTDGEEAVESYEKAKDTDEPFDVVIMDLTIPGGMGGKEAVERLREIDPGVKAIASSGYSDGSAMSDFRECGFSGFVAKPYKIQELSKVVRELITGIRE
jgi:PAS domain S-box-containing protein